MNTLKPMIYLLILLNLNLSCVQTETTNPDLSLNTKEDTLVFTSGIHSLLQDNKGNYWFGDRDTGAWKFDGKTMTNYTVDEKLKTQMIWSIYQDNNGDLLFAMGAGGVYQFNGKSFDKKY